MTGILALDWALLALSLFNAIVLLWLGLTVILNAERRSWGLWLTGGGFLTAAVFFVSHTAIVGRGLLAPARGLLFWWTTGEALIVAAPLAWVVVMSWYAGFWETGPAGLSGPRRAGLLLLLGSTLALVYLVIRTHPAPAFGDGITLTLSLPPAVRGVPLLVLLYPAYNLLCIGLAFDALRRPRPSSRLMGDLARRRARPWLLAASAVLLLVSLLVAGAMAAAVRASPRPLATIHLDLLTFAVFDVAIAGLIALAVVLLGQAIVAYEVFTGKQLPRRGLSRYWQRALLLAAGYSLLVGGSLAVALRPIYSLLLTALLMTVFYALLTWRAFGERETFMANLRPFVASQRLVDQLWHAPAAAEADLAAPFRALCADVLGARQAALFALGPLAPLAGAPLAYPDARGLDVPGLSDILAQVQTGRAEDLALDPAARGGAAWALPLWNERGLIGLFLLGEKRDRGLYTREEIDIARAAGERLIDTQASTEMARRLMSLQRQRLVQSQVLDRQARRLLHDDVLPQLQTAMLALARGTAAAVDETPVAEAMTLLAAIHRAIAGLLAAMPVAGTSEIGRLGLVDALRQTLNDELAAAFDGVGWEVDPQAAALASALPALTVEVLFYAAREALRNAAHHARGAQRERPLQVRIGIAWQNGLLVRIEDDGVGPDAARPAVQGSGQGLALHGTLMAVIGGTLEIERSSDQWTRVSLHLPAAGWPPGGLL